MRRHRRCILGRGELTQVVDAEAFFDIGDSIDHPLKAGLAEPSVLLVFEGLSQVAELLSGHHIAQRRENNGVFACLMRLKHPDERRHVLHQGFSRRLVGRSRSTGGGEHPVGEHVAALVLGAQYGGDVGEFARLFQLGEDILFLQVCVVVLDEASNDPRACIERLRGSLIAGLQAADAFSIDQQDALENSVLAHQVFGWSDGHFLC